LEYKLASAILDTFACIGGISPGIFQFFVFFQKKRKKRQVTYDFSPEFSVWSNFCQIRKEPEGRFSAGVTLN
jgi:hypothetical protein